MMVWHTDCMTGPINLNLHQKGTDVRDYRSVSALSRILSCHFILIIFTERKKAVLPTPCTTKTYSRSYKKKMKCKRCRMRSRIILLLQEKVLAHAAHGSIALAQQYR